MAVKMERQTDRQTEREREEREREREREQMGMNMVRKTARVIMSFIQCFDAVDLVTRTAFGI